jgi:hypothetical protein
MIKTLRLTVSKPVKLVLDGLRRQYPTLSDTEILKLSLSETAKNIESKALLLKASETFGFVSAVENQEIFDPKAIKKYVKK